MMITCIMSGAPSSDSSHPHFLSYELICLTFHQEAVKMSSKYNIKMLITQKHTKHTFLSIDTVESLTPLIEE